MSGTGEEISDTTHAYYTGLNSIGQMTVVHRVNNVNADTPDQAPTLSGLTAEVLFRIENTGDIELYHVKTYHDPFSPFNSGWEEKCVIGRLEPGAGSILQKQNRFISTGLE